MLSKIAYFSFELASVLIPMFVQAIGIGRDRFRQLELQPDLVDVKTTKRRYVFDETVRIFDAVVLPVPSSLAFDLEKAVASLEEYFPFSLLLSPDGIVAQ